KLGVARAAETPIYFSPFGAPSSCFPGGPHRITPRWFFEIQHLQVFGKSRLACLRERRRLRVPGSTAGNGGGGGGGGKNYLLRDGSTFDPTAADPTTMADELENNELNDNNPDFKPPAEKSMREILEADAEDESLKKYKALLLGESVNSGGATVIGNDSDPGGSHSKSLVLRVLAG
ncbi:PREDICTED: uncharacterized protein LOC106817205, partial [Priapulus caudatus]|uniref:Uncharacterized protein LOC106817205 n=1 Tax=Priapulus caudatus TaxID=37621 RepID=A0ABM1EYT5_PRICU